VIEGPPLRASTEVVVIRVVVVTIDEFGVGVMVEVVVRVVVGLLSGGAGDDECDNGERGFTKSAGFGKVVGGGLGLVGLFIEGRMTRWNVYASWGVS
jgi:hypothetical protein